MKEDDVAILNSVRTSLESQRQDNFNRQLQAQQQLQQLQQEQQSLQSQQSLRSADINAKKSINVTTSNLQQSKQDVTSYLKGLAEQQKSLNKFEEEQLKPAEQSVERRLQIEQAQKFAAKGIPSSVLIGQLKSDVRNIEVMNKPEIDLATQFQKALKSGDIQGFSGKLITSDNPQVNAKMNLLQNAGLVNIPSGEYFKATSQYGQDILNKIQESQKQSKLPSMNDFIPPSYVQVQSLPKPKETPQPNIFQRIQTGFVPFLSNQADILMTIPSPLSVFGQGVKSLVKFEQNKQLTPEQIRYQQQQQQIAILRSEGKLPPSLPYGMQPINESPSNFQITKIIEGAIPVPTKFVFPKFFGVNIPIVAKFSSLKDVLSSSPNLQSNIDLLVKAQLFAPYLETAAAKRSKQQAKQEVKRTSGVKFESEQDKLDAASNVLKKIEDAFAKGGKGEAEKLAEEWSKKITTPEAREGFRKFLEDIAQRGYVRASYYNSNTGELGFFDPFGSNIFEGTQPQGKIPSMTGQLGKIKPLTDTGNIPYNSLGVMGNIPTGILEAPPQLKGTAEILTFANLLNIRPKENIKPKSEPKTKILTGIALSTIPLLNISSAQENNSKNNSKSIIISKGSSGQIQPSVETQVQPQPVVQIQPVVTIQPQPQQNVSTTKQVQLQGQGFGSGFATTGLIKTSFAFLNKKENVKSKLLKIKKKKIRAYNVLVKRHGKFLEVGKNLPKGRAELLGSNVARTTLARTFKLKPAGTTETQDIGFRVSPMEFRRPKRDKTPLTFVQKKALTRGTGEIKEIQMFRRQSKGRSMKWL